MKNIYKKEGVLTVLKLIGFLFFLYPINFNYVRCGLQDADAIFFVDILLISLCTFFMQHVCFISILL
jgi:hypothetical protein